MMEKNSKIYIAGHKGLVGSAILRKLQKEGFINLILKTHKELDLMDTNQVKDFFFSEKPEYVFLAAAKVGGIFANNKFRGQFLYENLMIQNNVIHHSYINNVKKLLFLGSSCIYPKSTSQPISEEQLLTGELEYTNEPYALAKIAGIKLCESYNIQYNTNFISVMPTNLFGINDSFYFNNSHVLPALIRKIYLGKLYNEKKYKTILENLNLNHLEQAKLKLNEIGISENSIEIWGSGNPRREFLFSDDLADACFFVMEKCNFKDLVNSSDAEIKNTHLNIGTGKDISIRELAEKIKKIVGYSGDFHFNTNKPDGTYQKLSNVNKINQLGWDNKTELDQGIEKVYNWYIKN